MTTKIGTMTNEERLQKTIRLQKTDKILSGPAIMTFVAKYAGITLKEFTNEPQKAQDALEKTFNDMGGWDTMNLAGGGDTAGFALRRLLPGRELPDNVVNQIVEEEVMKPEDYDFLIDNGLNALRAKLMERVISPFDANKTPEERQRLAAEMAARMKANTEKWLARGVARLTGGGLGIHPFGFFSFHRSLNKFTMDVRRMPEKVKAASKACLPDMIANAKKGVEATGCRRVTISNSRGSSTFIGNKQFEEFVLPVWLEAVHAMTDADIDVVFHCDTDWTRFLPYFKEFPKGRCILQLDGATDIFKAKEVLGGHMTLMGDVPAPLLSLDTPEAVTAYCKKLIEVVGKDGGFILSSGCETPFNSKVENVHAMVKAGNELTWN